MTVMTHAFLNMPRKPQVVRDQLTLHKLYSNLNVENSIKIEKIEAKYKKASK